MRSNDLARIAGVTVKTLRHYHKIGLLPEPSRNPSNNYRSYTARHLARLLRIRRLSAIGLTLDHIDRLLSEDGADAEDALAVLDRDLGAQVDRLNQQRALIARLREGGSAPDIPLDLAPFYNHFAGMPDAVLHALREKLVLLELAVGEEGMPLLVNYFNRLTAPDLLDRTITLGERFYRLGPESPDGEIDDLIEAYLVVYAAVVPEYVALLERPGGSRKAVFLFDYLLGSMNAQQRKAFLGIVLKLDAVRNDHDRTSARAS